MVEGEGYAVGHIDAIGEGYGFRKVRKVLGVKAFGVNALVSLPGYETKWHYHDLQEELYFVHRGAIEMEFGDGSSIDLSSEGCLRAGGRIHGAQNQDPGARGHRLCVRGWQGWLHRPRRPYAGGLSSRQWTWSLEARSS